MNFLLLNQHSCLLSSPPSGPLLLGLDCHYIILAQNMLQFLWLPGLAREQHAGLLSTGAQNECTGLISVEMIESRQEARLSWNQRRPLCDCWKKCRPIWILGVSQAWFYKEDGVHFCLEWNVPSVTLQGVSFNREDEGTFISKDPEGGDILSEIY